ncbi:hypothetical protein [Pseudomonas aeruginosa]
MMNSPAVLLYVRPAAAFDALGRTRGPAFVAVLYAADNVLPQFLPGRLGTEVEIRHAGCCNDQMRLVVLSADKSNIFL